MTDYISRTEAIAAAFLANGIGNSQYRDVCDIAERLRKIPAADVVEIVRCKDCKYNQSAPERGNANCELFYGMTSQDGFCYCGERMVTDDV